MKYFFIIIMTLFLSIQLVFAFEESKFDFDYPTTPFDNNTAFVNRSNFWDNLDTPANIDFTDLAQSTEYWVNESGDTMSGDLGIVHSVDGGDVALYLRNTAGIGSSDETVSLIAQTDSGNSPMGKIIFGRADGYGIPPEEESFIDFYTTTAGTDTLALRIDENQDFNFTGSLINPKVDNKLMIGLGAVDTASISTVFGDDLIFKDETGSANVQWDAFGVMYFGGTSLSNVGNIDTTIIDATEIYNSATNFDIMPDAQYNVDVFSDGTISNSADGKAFKVHRNAVSETDSAVQLYNDRYSRPAIYGYGGDFVFWIPDDDILIYSSDGDIDLQGGSSGDVTIFEFAGSGENPSVRQGGYITNGANEVEVSWTVKDTDDYFHLDRENTNVLGLKINMPVEIHSGSGNLSLWVDYNISATGYITRTSVFNNTKNPFDYIKESDYYIDNGKINHSKFYGYTPYERVDYSRPVYQDYDEVVCNETIPEDERGKDDCWKEVVNGTFYPHNKVEEGVSLNMEIDVLRQAVYDLDERVKFLEENCVLK